MRYYWYFIILYFTVLYDTSLYYTILYYTILYYTILYYTILHYTILYYTIPVVPGQAGGGSFQKEKNYIAKKEFAYRMCARRPTSAMPKSFLCLCSPSAVPWWWRDLFWCHEVACGARWSNVVGCQVRWWVLLLSCDVSCHVMSVQYYKCTPVLQNTTPELLCTTKYYSSTTLHYKVQLQYYSVLQSTTPLLLQYYKVLLQYFFVLQSIIPDWSLTYETSFTMRGTTRVILQLHQILRLPCKMNLMIDPHHIWNVIYNARSNKSHPPTSPNTAPATQNESHDWSASHMKGHLQCAEQQESSSNFTKYCACHAKWISWLIRITYETSFTMRGATRVILQLHQILRLPRKMNLMIDPHHIWKVIYNARSNKSHPPTSANSAPATQNKSHDWPCSHMEGHLQCAEQQESSSNFTKYCACHAKWISWLIRITYETSFTMRGATRVILQLHQIVRLPRKINLMIDPHHIWNVIYNARSN